MRHRLVLKVLPAIIFLHLLFWMACPPLSAAFKRVGRGDKPPVFSLQDLEGKERKSTELLADKVSVVVFWSTWSPRSGEVLADLEKLRQELGPERFQIIAVNAEHVEISMGDQAAIRKMAVELNLTALILLDQGLQAYNDYGAMALPSTLVVDDKGYVVYDLAGYPRTLRSDLSDAVKKALGLPTSVELRPPEMVVPKNGALMYYNFGRRLMEKGQEEKGEDKLLTALERDPEFVKPRILLGIYFKKTGRLEEAMEQFRKVKELDPANEEASYEAAAVSLRAAGFAEAEGLFAELHGEFPEREEFALGLALAHKYQGREGEYGKLKEKADALLPAAARMLYDLGAVAESQGDLATAAPLYRRAIEGSIRK
jgi:tetratricopeptide (TPR) repeat protein